MGKKRISKRDQKRIATSYARHGRNIFRDSGKRGGRPSKKVSSGS